MNIKNLRIFCEVANRLSFAAVANDHNISPSSVSRLVSQVEDELGARLFQRNTRTMTLTEYGVKFLSHAMLILEEFDQAKEEARSESSMVSGTLRLTTSVAFAENVIVPLMPKFQSLYPEIDFQLIPSDFNIDLVSENIDLAIRLAPRISGNVIVTKLFPTRYGIYASPSYINKHGHPEHPSALSNHQCILYALPGFSSFWKFRERNTSNPKEEDAFHVPINGKIALSSAAVIQKVAIRGLGPALLADWLVKDSIISGELVELFPTYDATATEFDTSAWIIYPSRSYLPQKVRACIDFLKKEIGQ